MDTFARKFLPLPDHDLPCGLHERIMRRVLLERLKPTFTLVTLFLVTSILVAAWHLGVWMSATGGLGILKLAIRDFDLDVAHLRDFAEMLWLTTPRGSLAVFLTTFLANGAAALVFWKVVISNIGKGRYPLPTSKKN